MTSQEKDEAWIAKYRAALDSKPVPASARNRLSREIRRVKSVLTSSLSRLTQESTAADPSSDGTNVGREVACELLSVAGELRKPAIAARQIDRAKTLTTRLRAVPQREAS